MQNLQSPISDCVQWFNAAFLAKNIPEAVQILLRNQKPLKNTIEGYLQSGDFGSVKLILRNKKDITLNPLIAHLTEIERLMDCDVMQIGRDENTAIFVRDLRARSESFKEI